MKKKKIMNAFAIAAVLTAAFAWRFDQWYLPNFHCVAPDILYRSGQPKGPGLTWLKLKGIRTIVNLRGADKPESVDEKEFSDEQGLNWINIPVGTTSKELEKGTEKFMKTMSDPENFPVLIHCSRGKERSGLFSAVYRIEFEGWSNQKALAEMYELGMKPGAMPLVECFVWNYCPSIKTVMGDLNQAASWLE